MTNSNPSQSDLILAVLTANRGEWCSMPELAMASHSCNIHSRIAELRKRGHEIENIIDHDSSSNRKSSFYRLKV